MAIRLENVKKHFRDPEGREFSVLDVAGFAVANGEQVCLVGGSGSGKTTFLNIIAGITLPSSGRVLFDEVDIAALGESDRDRFRAANVGYVFQTFNLLQGLTAWENVLVAASFAGHRGPEAKDRATKMLDRVGLTPRSRAKPSTLSVGEQQRVAIARALINRPKVVLADEPTANLDDTNGDQVLTLLREATSEAESILLLVTHEPRVRERFERVVPLAEVSR